MSEYTPPTDDVRNHYAYGCGPEHTWQESREGFDRWLRKVKAEAWEDARRSVKMIPHWMNKERTYGEFDLQPLGPDETSEEGAFMAVMEILNDNPYRD